MDEQPRSPQAPGSMTDLLDTLDRTIDDLPKRLKQCATFSRRNLHLIAVSTVSEMAEACGVAPSVYMRFCQALGFSGYTEMQNLLRARYTEFRPDYEARLANLNEGGVVGTSRLLADFVESGHKSLMSLTNNVTGEGLERIARGMAGARVVHLVGLRRAFPVVCNMAYLFDKLGVPATLQFGAGMVSAAGAIFPEDALFAVSFAPFSQETVALAQTTAARNIAVYGLTDSHRCPFVEIARETLVAREDDVAGFRTLTAPLTLSTALAVAVGSLRKRN
ncbi:MAG: MurR/RpiR family transcriptional regulator [Acuticoccus sp.]